MLLVVLFLFIVFVSVLLVFVFFFGVLVNGNKEGDKEKIIDFVVLLFFFGGKELEVVKKDFVVFSGGFSFGVKKDLIFGGEFSFGKLKDSFVVVFNVVFFFLVSEVNMGIDLWINKVL